MKKDRETIKIIRYESEWSKEPQPGSCRFCPTGQGKYLVIDKRTREQYWLCEEHKDYEPEGELT